MGISLDELNFATSPKAEETKPAESAAETQPAPEEKPWRREIDLGDGSGVQVFEADTPAELADKLVEAQANATRKIRELNRRIKLGEQPAATATPATPAAPKDLTPEEAFAIAQELQSNPTKAFEKIMAAQFGMSAPELRDALAAARAVPSIIAERDHAEAFVTRHPEYRATEANGNAMVKYMQAHNLQPTLENFETAFEDLRDSGLLELETKRDERTIVSERESKPARSGISARSGRAEVPRREPTDDDMRTMPLSQLRLRIQQEAAAKRRGR